MPATFTNIKQAQGAFGASGGFSRFGSAKDGFESITLDLFGQILLEWGMDLIEKARANLVEQDKISFGDLSDSFNANVSFAGTTYKLSISMADYFDFVNKGVQGAPGGGPKNNTTSPYRFSGKYRSIPVSVVKRWIIQNGLVNRTDKYRVAQNVYKRKRLDIAPDPEKQLNQTAWRIARSIYKKGIKYSGYWDDAVKDAEQELRARLATVSRNALTITIKNIFPKST